MWLVWKNTEHFFERQPRFRNSLFAASTNNNFLYALICLIEKNKTPNVFLIYFPLQLNAPFIFCQWGMRLSFGKMSVSICSICISRSAPGNCIMSRHRLLAVISYATTRRYPFDRGATADATLKYNLHFSPPYGLWDGKRCREITRLIWSQISAIIVIVAFLLAHCGAKIKTAKLMATPSRTCFI